MKNSVKADKILAQMGSNTKLGDLRKLAKEIEKNPCVSDGALGNRAIPT